MTQTMVLETIFRTMAGTAVPTDAMAVGRNDRGHDLGAESPGAARISMPFLLCTFWLAQAQALAGEVDQAVATFERAVAAINDVGLLAEEIDADGEMIGNFPQAFSHIGLVNAAWAIAEAQQRVPVLPDLHDYPFVQAVAGQAEDGGGSVEGDRVVRAGLGEQDPPGFAARRWLRAYHPRLDGVDGGGGQVRGHADRPDDLDAGRRYVDVARPAFRLADKEALGRAVVTALEAGQGQRPEHRLAAHLVVRDPGQQGIVHHIGVADLVLVPAEVLTAARYR
jgi:hypothetical protein